MGVADLISGSAKCSRSGTAERRCPPPSLAPTPRLCRLPGEGLLGTGSAPAGTQPSTPFQGHGQLPGHLPCGAMWPEGQLQRARWHLPHCGTEVTSSLTLPEASLKSVRTRKAVVGMGPQPGLGDEGTWEGDREVPVAGRVGVGIPTGGPSCPRLLWVGARSWVPLGSCQAGQVRGPGSPAVLSRPAGPGRDWAYWPGWGRPRPLLSCL